MVTVKVGGSWIYAASMSPRIGSLRAMKRQRDGDLQMRTVSTNPHTPITLRMRQSQLQRGISYSQKFGLRLNVHGQELWELELELELEHLISIR